MTMAEQLTNGGLWEKGLSLLESQLGPAQTLQFLAMISRNSFDYQQWRDKEFGSLSLDEILAQIKTSSQDASKNN
jgi:hypothetical protein